VTALALKHNPKLSIFNVSVSDDAALNEEKYARQVAEHLKIELVRPPVAVAGLAAPACERALAFVSHVPSVGFHDFESF